MTRFGVPLWVRLAAAMGLLAVVPVVVVSFSAIQVATRTAEESSQEGLRRDATERAAFVGRWLDDQARALLTWPQQFGDRLGQMSLEAQANFPWMVHRNLASAVTVVLVDGTGRLVVEPAYGPGVDQARAAELVRRLPLADALARPEEVHAGRPWLPADARTGAASVPLAVRAAGGPTPEQVRVLGVEMQLPLEADIDPTHAVALLDPAGVPLVGGGHPLVDPEGLRPLLGTGQVIDFRLEAHAGEVRGSLAPVPSSPGWTVVVAEPASIVLSPGVAIRERMNTLLLVAAASALAVALAVAGSLSRPIERLRNTALRVAEGELGVRAEIERGDELGELGRAFDHMSVRLEENRREIAAQKDEIEAFAHELQKRVDQRTKELRDAQEELVRTGQLAAVAELGAGLAHEINNPLAAVLGLAQLLAARSPDDPVLADLAREAERCREVVATLQRVTSSDAGDERTAVGELDEVLGHAVDLVKGPFRQRGIQLRAGNVPAALRVRADPAPTSRILAQVLNALRAGLEPGATVILDAEQTEGRVVLQIVADRPVAERLDRRDDWMASAHGLWVAAQLLERLGGRLERRKDGYTVVLPGA